MPFSSLGLSDFIQSTLGELGYDVATPIQTEAIPIILQGKDLLAAAQTGSGKTAAFALPILQRYSEETEKTGKPRYLVLTPTRELAEQVGASFDRYGKKLPLPPKTLISVGGLSIDSQIKNAQSGADIVVATPGRLIDLVEREAIDLSGVEVLVLDEADRLLALGFSEELDKIQSLLPDSRQNLLFSATFPEKVVAMAEAILTDPQKIQLEVQAQPVESISQRAIEVESGNRTALLRHLLDTEGWSRVLVFVSTKRRASNITAKLSKNGIQVSTLHGDLKQELRSKALDNFKNGKIRVLIGTDLVARGIDIAQLPAVVNYDLPRSPTDYTHRIGRTGRIGESGIAVSFISQEEHKHFQLIEKRCGISLERERIEGFEPTNWDPDAILTPSVPVKGKRKSKKDKKREAAALEKAKKKSEPSKTSESDEAVIPEIPKQEPEAAPIPEVVIEPEPSSQAVEEPEIEAKESVSNPWAQSKAPDSNPKQPESTTDEPEADIEEPESEIPDSSPWAQALKKIKKDEG